MYMLLVVDYMLTTACQHPTCRPGAYLNLTEVNCDDDAIYNTRWPLGVIQWLSAMLSYCSLSDVMHTLFCKECICLTGTNLVGFVHLRLWLAGSGSQERAHKPLRLPFPTAMHIYRA